MKRFLILIVLVSFLMPFSCSENRKAYAAGGGLDGSSSFPANLDTADTTFDRDTGDDIRAADHDAQSDAIIKIETKLGYSSSTATDNQVLTGTGVETSAWGSVEDTMMSSEDFGDFTCDGSEDGCTLNADAVDNTAMADDAITHTEMADDDHGDVSWSAGVATVEDVQCSACIAPSELGNSDFGDFTCAAGNCTLNSGSVTADELGATITLADGDLIDMSSINCSSATEGLLCPQTTDCSSATASGQLCWNTTNNALYIGTGGGSIQAGGSTPYDDIGDPDADGSISFSTYTGSYVSASDGWGGLLIGNTYNDLTSEATTLTLYYDDSQGDSEMTYLKMIADHDGTPVTEFLFDDDGFKVGNGTPSNTMDGEDAYVEGFLEVDGIIYADGGIVTASADDGYVLYSPETAGESIWYTGPNHDSAGDDNDPFEIRQTEAPGSAEFSVDPSGNATVLGDLTITGLDITADGSEEVISLVDAATAVNELSVSNSATGNPISLDPTGDDTNIGMNIDAKGTGEIAIGSADAKFSLTSDAVDITNAGAVSGVTTLDTSGLITANAGIDVKDGATAAGFIQIYEDSDDGTDKVKIQAQALAADYTLTLPTDDGGAGQYLKTDGSGGLSWDSPAGSGDITAVGDVASGAAFTADGDGTTLYFEGATADAFEVILTSDDPGSDVTLTLPAETGKIISDNSGDKGDFTCSGGACTLDANSVDNDEISYGTWTPEASGTVTFQDAELELPNTATDKALATAGEFNFNTTDEQLSFHSGADGEISGEAALSLIQHIAITFDPSWAYDQESTYRSLPLFYVGDDMPEGFTILEWRVNYVGGDPTTELDADLICDTTPDFNTAADATVMDALDTTNGSSTADSGFDSATCANGSRVYIHFGADPTDSNVLVAFDLWYYQEED